MARTTLIFQNSHRNIGRRRSSPGAQFFRDFYKNWQIYLLMLPGLAFLIVFSYIPMSGHVLVFENYNMQLGIWGSPFAGFKNFEFFFANKDWLTITGNTLLLNGLFFVFGMGLAIIMAIFINEFQSKAYKKLVQTAIFMPYFVSWLVVNRMVYALLGSDKGLIHQLMAYLGMEKVGFYNEPKYWRAILTITYVIKNTGYTSVIFIGSITSIDPTYYDMKARSSTARLACK